jgi:predicted dithiol-disulfide oxidoreductase (DUF899 family)
MKYQQATQQLNTLREKITTIRGEMRMLQKQVEPEVVEDHAFESSTGTVLLSALFGRHADLILIHNMGAGCPYCTMWADGYNGLYAHIADRASFVLASPDRPDRQAKFAASRGWQFPMVSDPGSAFAKVMGYTSPEGRPTPGISVLQKRGSQIVRVADASKGPYDDFCAAWHLFDLLPEGAAGWQPRFSYRQSDAA